MREKWIWMDWRMLVKHRGSKCDGGESIVRILMKNLSVKHIQVTEVWKKISI